MPTDRLRRSALLAAALLPLALGACRSGTDVTVTVDSTAAAPAPRPPADTSAAAPSAPAALPVVALDGEGLRLVDPERGSTRLLAFGAARSTAVEALAASFGAPRETGTNPDCGTGALTFATWPNGLTAWFQADAFAGWIASATADTTLTTMAGVGVGSPRTTVESTYAVSVEQTTLGTEFTAGTLAGLFTGPAPDARVETLWAGATCLFR